MGGLQSLSGETWPSCCFKLLSYTSAVRVCVGWGGIWGVLLGVEANGKWGSVELPRHMDVVVPPTVPQPPNPPRPHTHKQAFAGLLDELCRSFGIITF